MVDQESDLYLDVHPERITVEEIYAYEMKIRENPATELLKPPEGLVYIEVPYDGHKSFSPEAARKIGKSFASYRGAASTGRIGWLAMGKPFNWEQEWNPQLGVETVPVHIPLHDEHLRDDVLWTADELRAVIRHPFSPAKPRSLPLSIDLQVYDDETVPAQSLEEYFNLLQMGGVRLGELVLDLDFTLKIPYGILNQTVQVWLDRCEVEWPTIVTSDQLEVQQRRLKEKEEDPQQDPAEPPKNIWRYNPDRKVVEICRLRMHQHKLKVGSPLVPYFCQLRFLLRSPGEVISQDILQGQARVRVDGALFTGREIAWMDAFGQRRKGPRELVKSRTFFEAAFVANPSDKFDRRVTNTFRRWYFPGVALSVPWQETVAACLRDLGYQVSWPEKSDQQERDTVSGERLETAAVDQPMQLSIGIKALNTKLTPTRRERELQGGILVSTEMDTCDLVLQVRGQAHGPGSLLALDLEKLMAMLKSQFAAVMDLR